MVKATNKEAEAKQKHTEGIGVNISQEKSGTTVRHNATVARFGLTSTFMKFTLLLYRDKVLYEST